MARREIGVTLVTVAECDVCAMARDMLAGVLSDNASLRIDVRLIDIDAEPAAVVESGAVAHPTLIVSVDGNERVRLAGTMSQRRVLRCAGRLSRAR